MSKIGEPFFPIVRSAYNNPKFHALSHVAVCLLLELLSRWSERRNGEIQFGVRDAAAKWHCGQATACRALKELQDAGFITCTRKGHQVPEPGRPDAPSRWRINFMKGPETP